VKTGVHIVNTLFVVGKKRERKQRRKEHITLSHSSATHMGRTEITSQKKR